MKDRLITAGSYLLAGIVAITALVMVATTMENEPSHPVTAASQEAENALATSDAVDSMAQKPEGRVP